MKIAIRICPPAFGGLPRGVQWFYVKEASSRFPYGIVETDRDLTEEEIEHFTLEVVKQ